LATRKKKLGCLLLRKGHLLLPDKNRSYIRGPLLDSHHLRVAPNEVRDGMHFQSVKSIWTTPVNWNLSYISGMLQTNAREILDDFLICIS